MAGGSQLALLCALSSFLYIYGNIGRHSLLERPRISEVLILLISGVVSLVASFVCKFFPGGPGRFDDGIRYDRVEEPSPAGLPGRPRRYFWYLLLPLIVLRLELFRWLRFRLQCTEPGVECLLPLLLAIYDVFTSRKHTTQKDEDDEFDNMGNDVFDDVVDWFRPSRSVQLVGTLCLSYGAFVLLRPSMPSTVICPASENRTTVLIFQCLGVLFDAIILILTWRLLAWAQTTKTRLRRLSIILVSSSVLIALTILIPSLIRYRMKGQFQFSEMYGVDPLYFFDVVTDGLIFTSLFISLALFTCQSSPLVSTGTITLICGVLAAYHKLGLIGTYERLDSWVVLPIWTMCFGFVVFMYRNQARVIVPPELTLFLLLAAVIGTSIYALAAGGAVLDLHPIDKITAQIRTNQQRWNTQVTTSESLRVAVDEYRDRHRGRNPPTGFSEWYNYAVQRDSPIIDYFQQIDDDILPFMGMKPSKIRDNIARIGTSRDIGILSIKNGVVTHQPSDEDGLMDNLVELIRPFAQHLPDMDLPINLLDRPRVLASWSDKTRFQQAAMTKKFDLLTSGLNKREESSSTQIDPEDGLSKGAQMLQDKLRDRQLTTLWEHQRQLGQACAPKSPTRWGFYANNRDFCSACANTHAHGQYIKNWTQAQDICHQPDMFNLHGFYMAEMPLQPFTELVPVFGRSKTDRFSDILIPLIRGNDKDTYETNPKDTSFISKDSRLFWRGEVGADFGLVSSRLLSGGHQERLSHLANNASVDESVAMCLATPGDKDRFRYERVSLLEANSVLKFDAGMSDYSMCAGSGCDAAKAEFGFKPHDEDDAMKMGSRYVMVMDGDDSPPRDLLQVLRSNSVPLVASVFKEWYAERLFPWLHFVPIDLRFHGLHSTLAFFMGLQGKGLINGRTVAMQGDVESAKIISQEGRAWANKAIRREDAEIYMFRLLLEWGRVISDKRDEMDFVLPNQKDKDKET